MGSILLDAYYTPEELAAVLVDLLPIAPGDLVLEPSAGGGAFIRALVERTSEVVAIDMNPTAPGLELTQSAVCNFLDITPKTQPAWIVGNPPYFNAIDHVKHALKVSDQHVAFLLRLGFLESRKRLEFWRRHPCRKVFVLAERPSFTCGKTDSAAYGFFWWDKKHTGPTELEIITWKKSKKDRSN